jgi:hypothetical protein
MAFRPPFCPNPACPYHRDPDTPEGRKLKRIAWFKPFGSYHTKVSGSVPRFRCLYCRRTCSRQTFRLDYYVKRTVDYNDVRARLISCGGIRAIARSLGISPDSVSNRISRLSRQYISACAMLLPVVRLREDLVADGFESFAVSQYFPNNIHLLGGANSQYVFFADYAPLRRKGRMTPQQKQLRAGLEKLYRAEPDAIRDSFSRLLDTVADLVDGATTHPIQLRTDKKHEYCQAIEAHVPVVQAVKRGWLQHLRIDSRVPRTGSNPLFTVNYLDRQLRKDLAEHVRETVRFARNVCHTMERLWIAVGEYNFHKRFRCSDPVPVNRTHAGVAGIPAEILQRALKGITTTRRFFSFQSLPAAFKTAWRRSYETPLRTLEPGVIREVKRQAKKGYVNLKAVAKMLGLDSVTHDRPQYIPAYALQ